MAKGEEGAADRVGHEVTGQPGPAGSLFDVVALVSSAGGLSALNQVLHRLPADFGAAVVVMQHLGSTGSSLVEILRRRSRLPVEWIRDHDVLRPGRVYVCPPRQLLEVMPDAACSLRPMEDEHRLRPIDFFLISLADSYGRRAMAVVLTGMGRDAEAGGLAVSEAGGTVVVQNPESAEHPGMPSAVVGSGAADLVLQLPEIGPVIGDIVATGVLPRTFSERAAMDRLFAGPGEVAALLRGIDWARTPFGPVSYWPDALRTAVRLALDSPLAICVLWGPHHLQLYNDQYRLVMGVKHPAGLAQPNRDCWPEVWHLNEPILARVWRGEPVALHDALYPITRHGSLENAWFDLSYSPIRDDAGQVAGMLCVVLETTPEVLSRRRLDTLQVLAAATADAQTGKDAFRRAVEALAASAQDIPFAIGYLLDVARSRAQLAGAAGVPPGGPMAPYTIGVESSAAWPIRSVLAAAEPVIVDRVTGRFRGVVAGPDGQQPSTVLLASLADGGSGPAGVLILGASSLLPFNAAYRDFFAMVAHQIEAILADARGRHHERQRLQRLAELDRSKTEFFFNVSHEFRTPLTLLLSPLDELARRRDELPSDLGGELEVAAHNARRLLSLVDTLLDFSQLEAGHRRASLQSADLARLTANIAGVFRDAVERAGLRLRIDCPPLPGVIWVDPDMWEKIVSNLLSNALKHTFDGEVVVQLRHQAQHAELTVRDTGVGIPQQELPHIFGRFHRVRNAQARSHEGSGIGLSLVQELVQQLGGRIRVRSEEGAGTVFTVWIPVSQPVSGKAPGLADSGGDDQQAGRAAELLAAAASRWDPQPAEPAADAEVLDDRTSWPEHPLQLRAVGAHVLVADGNPDMRAYLGRLLGTRWRVSMARDGDEALRLARRLQPDLVLADVMMPKRDGVALLQAMRAEPALQSTPVILLTARAGQDAALDGLLAGANDYIAKPFSARELVARVGGQIALTQVRREGQERFRALIDASWDVVYRMSPDWTQLRALDGRGFIADTSSPNASWLDEYIHPDDQPRVLDAIQLAIRDKTMFELEHRVRRPDGSLAWTLSRAVPIFGEDGEITEWVGAAADVTERKQAGQKAAPALAASQRNNSAGPAAATPPTG
jgi:signal transduction histidine kinase/chemotaxis response regulator CheB